MAKLNRVNRGKKWTEKEIEYLKESYGIISTKHIAKVLSRTTVGVQKKARAIFEGMKRYEVPCLYSVPDLEEAFGVKIGLIYDKWVYKKGMPTIKHKARKKNSHSIDLGKFWDWLEKNKNDVTIYMNKVNLDVLEYYPDWFIEDYKAGNNYYTKNKKNWTKEETDLLNHLFYSEQKSAKEVASILGRTVSSVNNKITRQVKSNSLTKVAI